MRTNKNIQQSIFTGIAIILLLVNPILPNTPLLHMILILTAITIFYLSLLVEIIYQLRMIREDMSTTEIKPQDETDVETTDEGDH